MTVNRFLEQYDGIPVKPLASWESSQPTILSLKHRALEVAAGRRLAIIIMVLLLVTMMVGIMIRSALPVDWVWLASWVVYTPVGFVLLMCYVVYLALKTKHIRLFGRAVDEFEDLTGLDLLSPDAAGKNLDGLAELALMRNARAFVKAEDMLLARPEVESHLADLLREDLGKAFDLCKILGLVEVGKSAEDYAVEARARILDEKATANMFYTDGDSLGDSPG